MPTCNECLAEVTNRVELLTSTYRLLCCGRCALKLAEQHPGCVVIAFVPRQVTPWVTSDDRYFHSEAEARTYQRTLDARSRRFAERVRRVIARHLERRHAA